MLAVTFIMAHLIITSDSGAQCSTA